MSFFKRKEKNLIPPVASEQAARDELFSGRGGSSPSYRSNGPPNPPANPYGSNQAPQPPRFEDRYARRDKVGDVYSRGQGNVETDRNELFSGYKPPERGAGGGSGRFFDGPPPRRPEPNPGEENEEDVEGIRQQLRYTKQESVNSTRNALRLAREAEETARNTLGRLGDQSEKLANTERHLDIAKGHSQRAEDKTDELKQLNRSIFRPVITFNKDAKRAAQDAKVQQRYDEERDEREKAMSDIRETHDRLGQASNYGRRGGNDEGGVAGRYRSEAQSSARKEQRKRFQFDATASDDDMEDEIDGNLDEISDMTKRLKALGSAMGEELDRQNDRIGRITEKTDGLDNRIFRNTKRLEKIK
ncbi:hypothetical protein NLI96_g12009 [Meripilus lineatus]|uniref:t-SNARE coiled-coil homology domain-containing protein n=1 Tax=Meripilus lineatus TaxID=2056292 RepID=A0AAD5UQN9_9APHY|nr:hypothetical protein NLI96_g12009 [Physisporinus lineatus]